MTLAKSILYSLFLLIMVPATAFAGDAGLEKYYYALEVTEKLVGYMEVEILPADPAGDGMIRMTTRVYALLTLLGSDFDVKVEDIRRVDPATGKVCFIETLATQGDMDIGASAEIKENVALHTTLPGGETKQVELGPDVIVDNSRSFDYLIRDLGEGKAEKKSYPIFDAMRGEVDEVAFTYKGMEKLTYIGTEFNCLVLEQVNQTTGETGRYWFSMEDAMLVKMDSGSGRVIYRAEPAVVGKIKRAEVDDLIFTRVDVAIADYQAISQMTVRAEIRSAGEWVTSEILNVRGQKFTGTVEDNHIKGVFEIAHAKYDGAGAPSFPADFSGDESLEKYLEPEDLLESDDPAIMEKAKALTLGARDVWEAACRLSRWVGKEVVYEIPGGSARQTFETKKGECASHSRLLAAMCRAAGIPARLVSGCMYAPNFGGSFGQHYWNEIYMGEAGWVPVDSTANEFDYVDSGHIRLGEKTGFSPIKMEIEDFKAGSMSMDTAKGVMGTFEELPWETGKAHTFQYQAGGSTVCTDTFTITRDGEVDGVPVYACTTRLESPGGYIAGAWRINDQGEPIHYRSEGKINNTEYSIECAFSGKEVVEKVIQGGRPTERTIELPEKVYLLDNNNMSCFAFILSAVPRETGVTVAFKIFHPSSMQVLPMQVTVKPKEKIAFKDREEECWFFDVSLAGTKIKIYVDDQGRVIRDVEAKGAMVIDLAQGEE